MTKLTPKNIEWTIADDKIIKKLNDGTFAEVTASDITALGFQDVFSIVAGTTFTLVSLNNTTPWTVTTPTGALTYGSDVKSFVVNNQWTFTVSLTLLSSPSFSPLLSSATWHVWVFVNWLLQWDIATYLIWPIVINYTPINISVSQWDIVSVRVWVNCPSPVTANCNIQWLLTKYNKTYIWASVVSPVTSIVD